MMDHNVWYIAGVQEMASDTKWLSHEGPGSLLTPLLQNRAYCIAIVQLLAYLRVNSVRAATMPGLFTHCSTPAPGT